MLENLDIDDSDSPPIGLVPPGVSWAEVRDHIKIAHHHLLVLDDGDYTGAYWTGTDMALPLTAEQLAQRPFLEGAVGRVQQDRHHVGPTQVTKDAVGAR